MATYCVSDIHGNYEMLDTMLNFMKEDDQLIYLGDAIDRGSDGIRCALRLLNDNRVIYLKGNHEDMMINGIKEHWKYPELSIYDYQSQYHLWKSNGGTKTYKQFLSILNHEERINFINRLTNLPLYCKYINKEGYHFFLSHAGCKPEDIETKNYDLLWDREHINVDWPQDDKYNNLIIVHGHTPVQYFQKEIKTIGYCNGHKIDIDMGIFIMSNKGVMINLDKTNLITIQSIYIDNNKKEEK